MLNKIFLHNFQSIKEPTVIPMSKLTLAFGPNSAGKSAVMDAIEFLLEVLKSEGPGRGYEMYKNWRHRKTGRLHEDRNWIDASLDGEFGVGLDFTFAEDSLERVPQSVWVTRDEFGNQDHHAMLKQLVGHSIQLELRGYQGGLSLAVDGIQFLRCLTHETTEFDDEFNPLPDSTSLKNASSAKGSFFDWESTIGRLYLNLNHPTLKFSKGSDVHSLVKFAESKSPLIRKFIALEGETLLARGVTTGPNGFADMAWNDWDEPGMYDRLCSIFAEKLSDWPPEKVAILRRIDRVSPAAEKTAFRSHIQNISETLNSFLRGLLVVAADALDAARVSGSRGIITEAEAKFFCHESSSQAVPYLRDYGHFKIFKGFWEPRSLKGDFINEALTEFLPSFLGYKVCAAAYQVKPTGKSRLTPNPEPSAFGVFYIQDEQARQLKFSDVGSGVSYVLPILTSLWGAELSLIEQPELHLHPAAQCEVGDVLIAAASRGRQVFVETHSEHLILRILRRIRETEAGKQKNRHLRFKPADLSVLYFQPQPDGSTRVKQLRVDDQGEFIDRWPGGFFAEREKELFGE